MIYVVLYTASSVVATRFLPELPPLRGAILFAVLFALLGVALPFIVARRRSKLGITPSLEDVAA